MKPHCWWCCHSFDWDALHFPHAFVSNVFYTTGYFCSWECMKAYGIDRGKFETCDFITLMRKRVEGKVTHTKSAPNKKCLKMFGGTVCIEEFRKSTCNTIDVSIPGEIFQQQTVIKNDITNSTTGGLKLKRDKPLERSKSKLETSLGIIRKCPAAGQDKKQQKTFQKT